MEQVFQTIDSASAEEEVTQHVPALERQLLGEFKGAQSKFANGGKAA